MDSKIKLLENKITASDWILQGTLLRQYKQCGKTNCQCHQAKVVKKSLKEMKKIYILVEKWKLLSLRHLEKNLVLLEISIF